jgi:tetratricopeptide (TPR) repeat protein
MRADLKKVLFVFITGIVVTVGVYAQNGVEDGSKYGHGEDSVTCMRNWSTYKGYYKFGNYAEALSSWRSMFRECPTSYESLYSDGIKMYNSFIEKEKDPIILKGLLDTLEIIYMQRIKYFNKKGEMLGRFGLDLLRYRLSDSINQEKGYKLLEQAMQLEKSNTHWLIVHSCFSSSIELYKYQKLSAEKVIENYTSASDIIDTQLIVKPKDVDLIKVKTSLDQQLVTSGIVNCTNLVALFTPKYKQNFNNPETIKNIIKILEAGKCTETELYKKAVETQYQLNPSARSAYYLANMFLKKGNYDKAETYLKQGIEKEFDNNQKAKYYIILGNIALENTKQTEKAKQYAVEAMKLRNNWGAPYILKGKAYIAARETCGSNDFEKNAIFWVAVDKFEEAKRIDASCTEEANSLIRIYSQYYPDKNNAFFYGINPGDSYTVKCWINETTKARFN